MFTYIKKISSSQMFSESLFAIGETLRIETRLLRSYKALNIV